MTEFINLIPIAQKAASFAFEDFLKVVKGIHSSPDSALMEKLTRAIYFSDKPVSKVFFSRHAFQEFSTFGKDELKDELVELAVTYCSFVLSKLSKTESHNHSKAMSPVGFFVVSNWFKKYGTGVGQHFIVDFINAGAGMSAIDRNKERFVSELMERCCNEVFINGFMLECYTAGSILPVIAFLNYVDYVDRSLASSNNLLKVWRKNPAFERTVDYRKHDWLETIVLLFAENTSFFGSVKSDTVQACQKETIVEDRKLPQRYSIYDTYRGRELGDWIGSAGGPKKYRLC